MFDQFQFIEQNSVECWCDFWCKFGTTLYATILTIFTISNGIAKTPRDNFDFVEYKKCSAFAGHFFIVLLTFAENDDIIQLINEFEFGKGG